MNSEHEISAPEGQPRAELGMSRPDSPLESFFVWPLAAAALAAKANVRFLEDLMSSVSGKRSVSSSSSLPWTTSNTVALELASMRLRSFSSETSGLATLICAPYALHGATIADFAPGHSVVEALSQGGLSRVFVTDWRSAIPETRYFSIDNCLADLNVSVDELGPPVDLIGLCQGGWLALVYAARFPKKVRRLVLVGAPIDIAAAESPLSRFVADVPLRMFDELVREGDGIVHGNRMLGPWGISSRFSEAEVVLQNPPEFDSAQGRELCDRFRQWYAETLNLPGVFYLQVVKWIFKENQIAERCFVALGQQVDLAQLRAPIFLLAAGDDEVVSVDQLFATTQLVGTPSYLLEKMTEPCGHLSLFLGSRVLRGSWRKISHWLGSELKEPEIIP
jgi:poly(3-hydroxyalkanoate) synthetase